MAKQRHLGLWFLNFAVLVAGGLFAWVRSSPDSRLASLVAAKAADLPAMKAWVLGLLPKLREN